MALAGLVSLKLSGLMLEQPCHRRCHRDCSTSDTSESVSLSEVASDVKRRDHSTLTFRSGVGGAAGVPRVCNTDYREGAGAAGRHIHMHCNTLACDLTLLLFALERT